MKILVVGLNHKSAPIEIREKLAYDAAGVIEALRQLKNKFHEAEFVLLSTCNRVEVYCASKRVGGVTVDDLTGFLSEFHNVGLDEFQDYLYTYQDEESVRHLLMVASSMDSMVVGEVQIIGQVKEGYKLACATKSTGKILNRLFHCAFSTSKKIHTTTSISHGRVSVAGVAVELAMQLFADISSAKVVVIGAGEMGELLVQHLLQVGSKNITVVNRSYERGQNIARQYGISVEKWERLQGQLMGANIAIASASVKDYLFTKDSFKEIMDRRRKNALLIIDIAVPRNFESSVNEIEDVYLYSIDDLSSVVEENRSAREKDIVRGMQIVRESVDDFMDWFGAMEIGPLIGRMKEQFNQISRSEMERFFVGTRQEASCKEVMEVMVKRIVNKLLHCVIKNVNIVAKEEGVTEAAKMVDSIVRQAEEISSESGKKEDMES
ncbi:MAG: glutamyl-tRNA reductase [Phycisphaerae bacterium]|nr:glutamyl-tRNA reductase [Phycisphaerae bacterium]NIR66853.1 glutamyl-tRNA reductase [candidate division Zixibacteria bacterium]NIP51271.1 glutamyl-tRNA reductase [Phycisphaerae bacterium]NIS54008.1 glutamyl-tRNA reductase [Phycisphaerae bacterium]NIU11616.1 glutamyl-tRNA reductase [Phycisphaerae bacterium]